MEKVDKSTKEKGRELICDFMNWEKTSFHYKLFIKDITPVWEYIVKVVEKVEDLDLSQYHYRWPDYDENEKEIQGKERNNFMNITVSIEGNKCWIYEELELDPPHTLNKNTCSLTYSSKLEAVESALVEFIEYYNNLISNVSSEP